MEGNRVRWGASKLPSNTLFSNSNLNANNITSGTIDNARISLTASEIPNLDTSKITSGRLTRDRLPEDLGTGDAFGWVAQSSQTGDFTAVADNFYYINNATPVDRNIVFTCNWRFRPSNNVLYNSSYWIKRN